MAGKSRKSVARYITVGFDSEAKANQFKSAIEGNGLLIALYSSFVDENGTKKGKVNNIQARSCHEWTPTSWDRRRFEFGGVTIEFKDQQTAMSFLHLVTGFLSGEYSVDMATDKYDQEDIGAALQLVELLKQDNVMGARLERE